MTTNRTLTVTITAQDIKTAIRKVRDGWKGTPLTLAVRRAFDCKYLDPFVSVWSRKPSLYICRGVSYDAGPEADFIRRWEAGEPVRPMSIPLQHNPEKWNRLRLKIIKYHERLCWKCSAYVPKEDCLCGKLFSDRECSLCQAVFCKTCFTGRRPFSSCNDDPERHLRLCIGTYGPTFAHSCTVQRKAVMA